MDSLDAAGRFQEGCHHRHRRLDDGGIIIVALFDPSENVKKSWKGKECQYLNC